MRWCSREMGTEQVDMASALRETDLVVSAAGYNSYYEVAAVGVPVLWLPQQRPIDDQWRRARGEMPFAHAGPQRIASSDEPLGPHLEALMGASYVAGQQPRGRERIAEILQNLLQKGAPREHSLRRL